MATATGHGSPGDTPSTAAPTTATGVALRGAAGPSVTGVDLAVPAGELLAVVGPAGSRRTSLLLALGGRMRLRGDSAQAGAARLPPGAREVRRRVAVASAFGTTAPDPYDRVGELLDLAAVHAGRRVGAQEIGRALAAAGLAVVEHPEGDEPGVLARGARYERLPPADRLLLAVALALVGVPEALLVDGVDDGQDDDGRHRVWTWLRRIADSGTTVVAAASSAAAAGSFAHRTVLLPHPTGGVADGEVGSRVELGSGADLGSF